MSARANTTNSQGSGMSQVSGGNMPAQIFATTYPRPAGQTITVTRATQGSAVGDPVERDSDGGFWNTSANVNVPSDAISIAPSSDMLSA